MSLRSNTQKEILAAFRRGEKIWALDAGTPRGDHYTLVGNDREEIAQRIRDGSPDGIDILAENWGWTLKEIGSGDEPLRGILRYLR